MAATTACDLMAMPLWGTMVVNAFEKGTVQG